MAKKTDDVITINFDVVPHTRDGEVMKINGGEATLAEFSAIALDNAVLIKQGAQGPTPVQATPGDLRKRTKLADKIIEGGIISISEKEKTILEECIAAQYMAGGAGRILAALVPIPDEDEDEKEDVENE